MKTTNLVIALAAAAAAALASPAGAAVQVFATSYDMLNGDGVRHTGTYNYWDKSYTGAGHVTVDGAALSGGLGDLTDGVIATVRWNRLENTAGTGPYVGWNAGHVRNPLITFHFEPDTRIEVIRLHVDNSSYGSVRAPGAILIDGVAQAFTPPPLYTWGWIDIGGLNLSGGAHTVQLKHALYGPWVFLDEVQFNGDPGGPTTAVPEPSGWAMMLAGIGISGALLRRRRTAHTR